MTIAVELRERAARIERLGLWALAAEAWVQARKATPRADKVNKHHCQVRAEFCQRAAEHEYENPQERQKLGTQNALD